jgi:tetratricopeptide (TPR) repeat protein
MESETPAHWLRRGQAAETHDTAASLAEAVQCYDRAIALLRAQPLDQARRELGIAWMNRGNARQKQSDPAAASDAVDAYDEAIKLLSSLLFEHDPALRNSIGAAWMNRGHALQRDGNTTALRAAIISHDRAIEFLQNLTLDHNRSFLLNLAAAWMNRAQALLALEPIDSTAAHDSALKSLGFTAEMARTDQLVADITLKAYHALCLALAHQLTSGVTAALIAETGDTVDESLALVRHWEQHGVQNFRSLAVMLFRFGAQFHLAHQPQFLAEFLVENIESNRESGSFTHRSELLEIATSTLAQARADAYNRSLVNPRDERLQQLRQGLEAAEKRLREIQGDRPTLCTCNENAR